MADDAVTALADFAESGARQVRLTLSASPEQDLPEIAGLLAGAAEADITPPPGMPKAGHSRNAHTGTGSARGCGPASCTCAAGRTALTLVQNDLLAGSAVLQHLVAQACADLGRAPDPGCSSARRTPTPGPGSSTATR